MTTKADFTEEEWARLGRAPLVAGMAISLADPGGPIETLKESTAALQTVLEAARSGTYGDFVQAVARDFAEKARSRQNPMAGFKPKGRGAGEEVLTELRGVNGLLVDGGSVEALAVGLQKLLADLPAARTRSEQARRDVGASSWRRVADAYDDCYAAALALA